MDGFLVQVRLMRSAGLEYEQIIHLVCLRERISARRSNKLPSTQERLDFYRYLYASGRLHDGAAVGAAENVIQRDRKKWVTIFVSLSRLWSRV